MNNCSFFGSSFYSTTQNEFENNSWSNICCDWSTFSSEQELVGRKESAKAFLQEVENIGCIHSKEEKFSELKSKLQDLHTNYTENREEHYAVLKDYEENLRIEKKRRTEELNNLLSQNKKLKKNRDALVKEVTTLYTDNKLQKEAYQKALRMYSTYFDLNVSIEESSDDLVFALRFDSVNNMEPIKIVVDKNKKKIIDVKPRETLNENFTGDIVGPEILYHLYSKIHNCN